MGKQKDARFPSATKASTTELLDRLLPQVEANLKAGSARPKPSAPMKERSKCPCNHRCLASGAGFGVAMRGLLRSPKLVAGAVLSSWSAHSGPHDQKVRRAPAHLSSQCEIRGPLVSPWASKPTQAHLRLSDSKVLPLEPIPGNQLGQIAARTQKARCLLGQLLRQSSRQAKRCRPRSAICLGPHPLGTERWPHVGEGPAHLGTQKLHPHPNPRIVPWEEGRGRRSNRHPRKSRCDLLGQARCPSRRSRTRAWQLHCQSA